MSDDLIEALGSKGTHTSDVDVVVQSFLEKYFESGQLKVQVSHQELQDEILSHKTALRQEAENARRAGNNALADDLEKRASTINFDAIADSLRTTGNLREGTFSAFQQYMRRKAGSSSAITLTTNVRDMNMISDDTFNFLANTAEGNRKISLSVNAEILQREFGVTVDEGFEGTLRYMPGARQFEIAGLRPGQPGVVGYNVGSSEFQDAAQALIQRTLQQARYGAKEDLVLRAADAATGTTAGVIQTNTAQDLINNVSMSNLLESQVNEVVAAKAKGLESMAAGTVRDFAPEHLALTKSMFNTGGSAADPTIGLSTVKPVIYGDVLDTGVERIDEYTARLLDSSLPYATIDPRSRVLSVQMSSGTASIGKHIFEAEAAAVGVDSAEGKAYRAIADNVDNTSEYALTYFMGQGKGLEAEAAAKPYARIVLGESGDLQARASRTIIPYDVFKNLTVEVEPGVRQAVSSADYMASGLGSYHMSFPQLQSGDDIVNLIFHHQFAQGEEGLAQAEDIVRQINRQVIPGRGEGPMPAQADPIQQMKALLDREAKMNLSLEQVSAIAAEDSEEAIRLMGDDGYTAAKEAYDNIVRQQARNLMDPQTGGIVGISNQGVAATEIKEAVRRIAPEIGDLTDTELQNLRTRVAFFGEEGVAVGAISNSEAELIAQQIIEQRMVAAGATDVAVSSADTVTATMAANARGAVQDAHAFGGLKTASEKIADDVTILDEIAKRTATPGGKRVIDGRRFWQNNKAAIAIGATALTAGYLYGKHRENKRQKDLIDETLQLEEPQEEQRRFGVRDALLDRIENPPKRLDPLATAGVVGGLDRSKINHHSMDPHKNNHLFRG